MAIITDSLAGSLEKQTAQFKEPDPQGDRVGQLVLNLEMGDPDNRERACRALAELGPKAASAVPVFRFALRDHSPNVQSAAVLALTRMSPKVKEAIPALREGLFIGRPINVFAARGLASFGKEAIPALLKSLPHPEAVEALKMIGPDAKEAVPRLLDILVDEKATRTIRAYAVHAVGAIGHKDAVATLSKVLKSQKPPPVALDDGQFRLDLIAALLRIHPESEFAVQALHDGLKDIHPNVQAMAAFNLAQRDPKNSEYVKHLLTLLNDKKNPYFSTTKIVDYLGKLGTVAKEAFPAIAQDLLDPQTPPHISGTIPLALVRIDSEGAVPVLTKALKNQFHTVRIEVVKAMAGTKLLTSALKIKVLRG